MSTAVVQPVEDAATATVIRAEQTRLLYAAMPVAIGIASAVVVVVVITQWAVIPQSILFGWLAAHLVVSGCRLLLGRAYRRRQPAPHEARRWLCYFLVGVVCSGLVWGAAGLLLLPSGDPLHEALVLIAIAGIGAGAITSLAAVWGAVVAFILPLTLPLAAHYLLADSVMSMPIAGMVLLFMVGVLMMSRIMSQNVTANIRLRLQVEAQRERYRALVESTSAIVWEGDPVTFQFTFVSREAESLLGYPVRRWLDEPEFWTEHMHPDDRRWVPDYCAKAVAEMRQHSFDYRMIHADGRIVWLHDVVNVLADNGRPVKNVGVMIDVTGAKRNERLVHYVSGLQNILVDLSRRFIDCRPNELDSVIADAVARTGEYCDVDRSYLFQCKDGGEYLDNTHEWCKPGILPALDHLQNLPRRRIPRLVDAMEKHEVLHVGRISELGRDWETDRTHFERRGVRSLVVVPIVASDRMRGFIGFDSISHERLWGEEEVRLLRVLADLIGTTTERAEAEQKIHYLAQYDSLTGLPNRSLALDRLHQSIKEISRYEGLVGVLYLDVDHFKNINDTLGHDVGNQVLVEIARRLSARVRDLDTVARLSGDEFLIIALGLADARSLRSIGEALMASFREPFVVKNRRIALTASIGIAVAPEDGCTSTQLLRNADIAMYQSKAAGRNTYHYFTESMNEDVARRAAIEEDLRNALKSDELDIVYQPIVELSEYRAVGAEALLRCRSGNLDEIEIEEIIPIAERMGLIYKIGDYVLQKAIRQCVDWRTHYYPDFQVSVNVSPQQLQDQRFGARIERTLAKHGLPGNALQLEITESVLLAGQKRARETLRALRKLGVGIAMDDFGTGYSSLSYLRQYPFDALKIDRSFVRDMTRDKNDLELVVTSLRLAQGLELAAVAEGVESDAQVALLVEHGCRLAQGYLFSQPVEADALTSLIGRPAAGTAAAHATPPGAVRPR